MGHINPTTQRPIHHSDRFFLGGMSGNLRGFKKCSIGEYKDGCALFQSKRTNKIEGRHALLKNLSLFDRVLDE